MGSLAITPAGLLPATLAEVLALASGGAVTPATVKGLHCGFAANRTADQTGMTGAAYNKVQHNNELFDSHGFYDNVTNFRFTPLIAGTYFCWALLNSTTGSDGPQNNIYRNGAVATGLTGTYNPGVGGNTVVFGALPLNGSTDYLENYNFNATGVTTISGGGGRQCLFGAIRIGN